MKLLSQPKVSNPNPNPPNPSCLKAIIMHFMVSQHVTNLILSDDIATAITNLIQIFMLIPKMLLILLYSVSFVRSFIYYKQFITQLGYCILTKCFNKTNHCTAK